MAQTSPCDSRVFPWLSTDFEKQVGEMSASPAVLVTGSAGHLGEALVRVLTKDPQLVAADPDLFRQFPEGFAFPSKVLGLDKHPSEFTHIVMDITSTDIDEWDNLSATLEKSNVKVILHTATLHKPHIEKYSKDAFVQVNVSGTLRLLEAAVAAGVSVFVLTSTTSTFGHAIPRGQDASTTNTSAVPIDETVAPLPRNIYGVTKLGAENMVYMFHQTCPRLHCAILRVSRFFQEDDDNEQVAAAYDDMNLKAMEYLYRRADISDMVVAHGLAMHNLLLDAKSNQKGFCETFVVSAPPPFFGERDAATIAHQDEGRELCRKLSSADGVLDALSVASEAGGLRAAVDSEFKRRGWKFFPEGLDRVYLPRKIMDRWGWKPRYTFQKVIAALAQQEDVSDKEATRQRVISPLAMIIGKKPYR